MRTRASAEEAGLKNAATLTANSLADLRALSAPEAQKVLRGAGMIVDGWIVREDLSMTFAQGRQNAVDVLVGYNKDEGSFVLRGPTAEQWIGRVRSRWGDLTDSYLKLYPAGSDAEAARSSEEAFRDDMFWHMRLFAQAQVKRGNKAYLYYFTHEPPTDPGKPNLRATHTAEIPYVFNNLAAVRVFPDGSSPALASASPRDRELAETISSYWVNFARSGNPNGRGLRTWPAFHDNGQPMILDDNVEGQHAPESAKLALYDALYARMMAGLSKN
jgi:para-nitrobenzyl esterase